MKRIGVDQTDILTTLHRQGALTAGELADWTGISVGRLPRLLGAMADRGLVSFVFAHDCTDGSLDFLWWVR